MNWDVERFENHSKFIPHTKSIEAHVGDILKKLRNYFKLPDQDQHLQDASTVVDTHQRILLWLLPDIICKMRVVS
jgi:hypothetical protein